MNPFDIPDDPYRTAGPGELAEEHEDLEDEEPPEEDGECFRGGEAAAYNAEEQARIQRELK